MIIADVEMAFAPFDERLRELNRPRSISRRRERLDQAMRDIRMIWIVRRVRPPPSHRGIMISARLGRDRQPIECRAVHAREALPLLIDPLLEFARVLDEEPVEERSGIQSDRRLIITTRDRCLKVGDIAEECRGIGAELIAGRPNRRVAELLAKLVDVHLEEVARRIAVALGPEQRDQLVASHRAAAVGDQESDEGERVAVGRPTPDGGAIDLNGRAAEQGNQAFPRGGMSHTRF